MLSNSLEVKEKVKIPEFADVYKEEHEKLKKSHMLKNLLEQQDYFKSMADEDVDALNRFTLK